MILLVAARVARRHGRPAGYTAIALAAFASWAGVPGAGEAALITGAAFAARHRLDIVQVELYAFAGALTGGMVGWAVGRRFGYLAERPGPLYGLRRRGLRAGERFFARYGPFAVFFTPSWVAGIHSVPTLRYTIYNAVSALIWTLGYGLTTYIVGPSIADALGDLGTYATIVIAVVGLVALALALRRRRRRARP